MGETPQHSKRKLKLQRNKKTSTLERTVPFGVDLKIDTTTCPSTAFSSSRGSRASRRQKVVMDAVLRMMAMDMLPFSMVEAPGFRSFMVTVSPQFPRLSQRTVALRLYDEVEKITKPRLIKQLRSCLSAGNADIHATVDVWAGEDADPVLAVQLHFLDCDWTICRPTVAFRQLSGKDLTSLVRRELENVLLSYGLFPDNVGYLVAHEAKTTISTQNIFCDYRIMHSVHKNDTDEDELVDFLDDQVSAEVLSELSLGSQADCVSSLLQLVIKEALKSSKSADYVLSQLRDIVAFFRRSAYWNKVLVRECKFSFASPHSYSSYCWNSTFANYRKVLPEFAWGAVMYLLGQARKEANDGTVFAPEIHIKREQVVDLVSLLEPFEEAVQVLQADGATFSLVIPSVVGIEKLLEAKTTNFPHFCKALRRGLREHFQHVVMEKDLILATALDPRIKLHPFAEQELSISKLVPPTRHMARSVLESALSETSERLPLDEEDEPSAASELDLYLSEPLLDGGTSILCFWRDASRFPQLRVISHRLLPIPATSGGFKRLFPLAASIVRARRNRLPQHTMERLLLYRECLKFRDGKK